MTTSNTISSGEQQQVTAAPHVGEGEQNAQPSAFPRVLVWTWTSPYEPSGSPAILAEILKRMPVGSAEVVCEARRASAASRADAIPHPVTETSLLHVFWPSWRGSRPRRVSRVLAFPLLLIYGLWRVWRFRPDCIVTLYFDSVWILSSYLLSKLTRTPVVYYVHDPYREAAEFRGGVNARMSAWLEPRSLRQATVVVLYNSLREHYRDRYGVESTVVRHLAPRTTPVSSAGSEPRDRETLVVGFAGAIYDNNRSLVKQLLAATAQDSRFQVRMWTNASPAVQTEIGADADHVSVTFESAYDRLLEGLSGCDLLYLPLAFGNMASIPVASLSYVLPTKSVDYLLTGRPILVHCPVDYETARFFREFRAGHVLAEEGTARLGQWLAAWRGGQLAEIKTEDRQAAIDQFSAQRNSEAFFDCLRTAVLRN